MSEELGDACDSLLDTTSILSHTYGIPKIGISTSQDIRQSKTRQLENEYYTQYQQLTHKVNKIMYLNKLKEIDDEPIDRILVDSIRAKYPYIHDDESLETFLKTQNDSIKTDKLLNRYLLMTLPILRSIYQHDSEFLSDSERVILSKLKTLYDEQDGLVFKLLKQRKNAQEKEEKQIDQWYELGELISEQISPLLKLSNELNVELHESNQEYVDLKESKVEEGSGNRMQVIELVNNWRYLDRLIDVITLMISSLPINWYEDPVLLGIMNDCDKYSQRLKKLQSIINAETIGVCTTQELFALEFNELGFNLTD
ncbi:uncharacterized protein J8A68_003430 [[Candida] subhashii]|uniref:Uncharacterized protein n=1 Tax=[Candida] subhashii TaxID=561895 RepID=A0A8J5UHK7_9ASCO|nr:uncharacterized protein J8A68_003430 [[Candida] subhashii]KAG7663048.1 hypothetical protein J8A68_003430 [[Candida] subhashii]